MRSYGYTYQPEHKARGRKGAGRRLANLFFLCAFLLFIYVIGSFIFKFFTSSTTMGSIISPVTASINAINNLVNRNSLESVVKKSLEGAQGTYAVAIKNLKTGESYYLNQDTKFETASLYKLWVMALAYNLIEQGKLNPDKKFNKNIAELNKKFDIASESAELTDGKFTLDVRTALNQMITISHNYSALALTQELKISKLGEYIKSLGLVSSKVGDVPMSTASDVEYFYEKLYSGQLGNKESTAAMMDLLKKQQINDRLPKYLPAGTVVAHKTGELDSFKHDAGIVYARKGNYIIVLMSKTDDESKAAEREALLSKAVYTYFENK